ncbi:protein ApaG [Fulvitalea axinellae]|uniref:Protein ApaG n=1 Tax=Fulvitalea axinellae TaxID=1182444 RepID=A0AAU9DA70_9BACT|nr:protein ApaG [Fulvitalea axinellae]
MFTKITEGVKVSVDTEFQASYSDPAQSHFVFTYKVRIENLSSYTVQLLTRNWNIQDSFAPKRNISGEGVVGVKPIIEPGDSHEYVSGCNLLSELGKMCGSYTFERILNGEKFFVSIPEFVLCVPYRLN